MKWAVHVERMPAGKLAKIAENPKDAGNAVEVGGLGEAGHDTSKRRREAAVDGELRNEWSSSIDADPHPCTPAFKEKNAIIGCRNALRSQTNQLFLFFVLPYYMQLFYHHITITTY